MENCVISRLQILARHFAGGENCVEQGFGLASPERIRGVVGCDMGSRVAPAKPNADSVEDVSLPDRDDGTVTAVAPTPSTNDLADAEQSSAMQSSQPPHQAQFSTVGAKALIPVGSWLSTSHRLRSHVSRSDDGAA